MMLEWRDSPDCTCCKYAQIDNVYMSIGRLDDGTYGAVIRATLPQGKFTGHSTGYPDFESAREAVETHALEVIEKFKRVVGAPIVH